MFKVSLILIFVQILLIFNYCLARYGKSTEDDKTKYSCSRNLHFSSYVSRNNKNSSCEEIENRGIPKIFQWFKKPECTSESIDVEGILKHLRISSYI